MNKSRKKEFREAQNEFTRMRFMLLLGKYSLHFSRKKPKSKNAAAVINVYRSRAIAAIKLADSYYNASPTARRHYIVHELLHIFLAEMDYQFGDLRNYLPPNMWEHVYGNYKQELERVVDGLADVIEPLSWLFEKEQECKNKSHKKKKLTRKKVG